MEERIRPTRSGLFAIELLIAVGIFTFCAAICVGLFVKSEVMSRDSAELTRAVACSRSLAECYKAAQGDLAETASLAGGVLEGDTLLLTFDGAWSPLHGGDDEAAFVLRLEPLADTVCPEAALTLRRTDGEALVSWRVAAPEVGP